MGGGLGLGTVFQTAAEAGVGAATGVSGRALGTSLFTSAVSLINPLLGGIASLIALAQPSRKPYDILKPLKLAEQAIAEGRYEDAARAARTFDENSAGSYIEGEEWFAVPRPTLAMQRAGRLDLRASDPLPSGPDCSNRTGTGLRQCLSRQPRYTPQQILAQAQRTFREHHPGSVDPKDIRALQDTQAVFPGLTSRDILCSVDVLPGDQGVFSLLPIGSVSPVANKVRFCTQTAPLPIRRGTELRDQVNASFADYVVQSVNQTFVGSNPSRHGGSTAINDANRARALEQVPKDQRNAIQQRLNLLWSQLRSYTPIPTAEPAPAAVAPPAPAIPDGGPTVPIAPRYTPNPTSPAPGPGWTWSAPNAKWVPIPKATPTGINAAFAAKRGKQMSLTGFVGGLTNALTPLLQASVPLAQSAIAAKVGGSSAPVVYSPYTGAAAAGALAGAGLASGAPGVMQVDFPQLDLPFVDITSQGSAGAFSPFYTTAGGQQRAQPHMQVRSNGKVEWFIPAGQPKTWTKASRKRRPCPSRCRPARRRRRPR